MPTPATPRRRAPLLAMLAHTRDAGFVDAPQVARLRVDTDPQRLLQTLHDQAMGSPGGRVAFDPV